MEWHAIQQKHPYYPPTAEIANYVPNRLPMPVLLGVAMGAMGAIVTASFFAGRARGRTVSECLRLTWFALCTSLHCGFEAYWVYNHDTMAGRTDLLAELWKEYANGDSRYLTKDAVVLALETITVCVWGPLCFSAARAVWKGSPTQHIWQLLASTAHLFSTCLYFVMDWPYGFPSCNPHPLYFWVYFVAFNSPWLVVPALLFGQSFRVISSALHVSYPKSKEE